jgi:hypothetical protein
MSWGPFSAEAVLLDSKIRELHKGRDATAAIEAIGQAMERAHRDGPSNMTWEEFDQAASLAKTP